MKIRVTPIVHLYASLNEFPEGLIEGDSSKHEFKDVNEKNDFIQKIIDRTDLSKTVAVMKHGNIHAFPPMSVARVTFKIELL